MLVKTLLALAALATLAASMDCKCISCDGGQNLDFTVADCVNCQSGCNTNCPSGFTSWQCAAPSSSGPCFPEDATVELENGDTKTMAQLAVGDKVLVGPNLFSEVYMFSHKNTDATATFVTLATSGNHSLALTADHYIYANDKLMTAGSVKVGDVLQAADGSEVSVTAVSSTTARGLYNPHTLSGDIVVNGIKTSAYTAAVAPGLAHGLLWPVRLLHTLGYDVVNGAFDQGDALLLALSPTGREVY
eukprot:m.411307 g.411307  ORF g.411307 m.411307 type:complete len:246 (-) comp56552_c0_seq18:120-857(-)